jgi:hypothetical protein
MDKLEADVVWAHEKATEVFGGVEEVNRERLASPEFAEAFPEDPEELYRNKRVLEPAADDNNSKNPSSGRQAMLKRILDKRALNIEPLDALDSPGSFLTSIDSASMSMNVDNENVQRPNQYFLVGMTRRATRLKGQFFSATARQIFGLPREM